MSENCSAIIQMMKSMSSIRVKKWLTEREGEGGGVWRVGKKKQRLGAVGCQKA